MANTLDELLAEFGLSEDTPAQSKTASSAVSNDEVEQVLQSLQLDGAEDGVEKVASANEKGENMSLQGHYEQLFGDVEPTTTEETGSEKVASAEGNEATELFGELTAHYFSVAQGGLLDKVAASVEDEVDDANETPMKHLGNNSQLTNSMGKPADPAMPVNHSASSGAELKTMTGNTSPYSLKEQALKKAILKRLQAAPVGAFKD